MSKRILTPSITLAGTLAAFGVLTGCDTNTGQDTQLPDVDTQEQSSDFEIGQQQEPNRDADVDVAGGDVQPLPEETEDEVIVPGADVDTGSEGESETVTVPDADIDSDQQGNPQQTQ